MAKAVREADGKALLAKHLQLLASENGVGEGLVLPFKSATVQPNTDFKTLVESNPWLKNEVSEGIESIHLVKLSMVGSRFNMESGWSYL